MKHNLIQIRRGKREVVFTDDLKKVKARQKLLQNSLRRGIRGERVSYEIEEAAIDAVNYKRPRADKRRWGAK